MINAVINEYTYPIPTVWEEVTLGQWMAMARHADELNHIRILSIFTGLDYDVLANFPCDAVRAELLPEMGFIGTPMDFMERPRPAVIKIGPHELEPITDPGRERFGQKLFMQQLVEAGIETSGNHWDLVAPTIACYYAPYIHPEKKWDDKHAKTIYPLIEAMPVVEAYPEAVFFLNGYIKFGRPRPNN